MPFPEEVQNKTKTESSTSKQKHIFTFDKHPIDSSCFQVPDSGFKFQDLAIARISLVHSTATFKNRGKVRYSQCFLLGYGSLSTLQDAPGELQKLLGWILGGGDHIYIYICIYVYIWPQKGHTTPFKAQAPSGSSVSPDPKTRSTSRLYRDPPTYLY